MARKEIDFRWVVGFTGHRDRYTDASYLVWITEICQGALWVHGGAKNGFDKQVDTFARAYEIDVEPILPDFKTYGSPAAFFVRNKLVVDRSHFLVACYDGRMTGGTFHATNYARAQNKMILELPTFVTPGKPNKFVAPWIGVER